MISSTEDALGVIFEQLPPIKDSNNEEFPIKYSWGSEYALNLYLVQAEVKYPLVWLVEGSDTYDTSLNISRPIKLFIAKNSDNVNNTNPTIWADEFNEILNPILANVLKALEGSGITEIKDGKYKVSRLANYTESGNESKAIDNWNVIVIESEIKVKYKKGPCGPFIETGCINTIKFC